MTINIEAVHAIDDLCKVVGDVLRTTESDVELLTLAAHAIRNGRTDVAVEYVERVTDHLVSLRHRSRSVIA